MSIQAVSATSGFAPTLTSAPVTPRKSTTSAPAAPAKPPQDTVTISKAALAALAAMQEATETVAQTTREVGAGDFQAQQLLAREAARRIAAAQLG